MPLACGVSSHIFIANPETAESQPFVKESSGADFDNNICCDDTSSDVCSVYAYRASSCGVGCSILIVRPETVEFSPFADTESNGNDFVIDIGSNDIGSDAIPDPLLVLFCKSYGD